jgi:periplasmic divalent cation tolerance protein
MTVTVIISTYPNRQSILKVANLVVKKRLAACVNFTKIDSTYIWCNKLENTKEFLVLFKTTNTKKEMLKKEIKKLHPYQVPEIMELKVNSVNKPYLNWLIGSTRNKTQK